jgi:RHS repeat-associated protein
VKAGTSPTGTLDTWSYTYDGRGLRSTITKPNGNLATFTYHEDGLARIQTERTRGGKLVSSHSLRYHPDGDRSQDVAKVLKANSSEYLDQASNYTYTPARQLEAVGKTGVERGDNESYQYDAAGNVIKQTIGATTSTMTYDRNRLIKTVTGGTTMNHRYDPFGRSTTTDVGSQVVEQNAYDGYDRLVRQQKFDSAGTPTLTRNQTYDPFDRVTFQSEKVGSAQSVSTRYTFVGLADQVAIEEQRDTAAGVWKTTKSYSYGAAGENLSLVDSPVNGTTSKKMFYGANPRGDVETLTDASTGETTSTYRYTAYGQADKVGTTGDDAIKDDPAQDADIVNPYRFNSKRFDGATGTYDMGFREYNPGLNRFLTRDIFNGALTDMALGTDPWNANRYMFAGGNPISRIELTGHYAIEEGSDRFKPHATPTITSTTATGSSTTQVPNNVGQEINESMGLPAGASQEQQAIRMSQLGINPTIAGLKLGAEEADRAGVDEAIELYADVSGTRDATECGYEHDAKACGMTGLMLFPWGKLGKLAKALLALKHADDVARVAGPDLAKGYTSFRAAKRALPSPGEGNVYDHVVEQSQIGRSGFDPRAIHNPYNLNPVPVAVNQAKANYYASIRPFTGGQTVRAWLAGQSFADQYAFGMDITSQIQRGVPLP